MLTHRHMYKHTHHTHTHRHTHTHTHTTHTHTDTHTHTHRRTQIHTHTQTESPLTHSMSIFNILGMGQMKHFTKLILYYQSSSTVLYTQTTYLNFSGITEKVIICTAGHNCTGRECGHMYVTEAN